MSAFDTIGRLVMRLVPTRLEGNRIPIWNRLSYPNRRLAVRGMIGFVLMLILLAVLFPIIWMVITAFMPNSELYTQGLTILPDEPTLTAFEKVVADSNYLTWYVNSIVVAIGVVSLTVMTATLGGYGLTRLEFRFKKTFARAILFGYMFPAILLAIPMFIFWRQLGLIDNLFGLILAETAISLPFSLWLMWQYFQTVPYSLEESGQMAGATPFRTFYDIALPMAKPGMIAVGVFSFAVSWNQFTIPKILMSSTNKWVLVQGLFTFTRQHTILWPQIMAASALALVPPFLFVFFLQKYLLRGFRAGGIG